MGLVKVKTRSGRTATRISNIRNKSSSTTTNNKADCLGISPVSVTPVATRTRTSSQKLGTEKSSHRVKKSIGNAMKASKSGRASPNSGKGRSRSGSVKNRTILTKSKQKLIGNKRSPQQLDKITLQNGKSQKLGKINNVNNRKIVNNLDDNCSVIVERFSQSSQMKPAYETTQRRADLIAPVNGNLRNRQRIAIINKTDHCDKFNVLDKNANKSPVKKWVVKLTNMKFELNKNNEQKSIPDPTPIKDKLRQNVNKNYEESILESSSRMEENKPEAHDKIPIYKQQLKENITKNKGDLYEFDSDTEKETKKRRKKDSDTDYQDPTQVRKRKRANSKNKQEYNKVVEDILVNVMRKVNKRINAVNREEVQSLKPIDCNVAMNLEKEGEFTAIKASNTNRNEITGNVIKSNITHVQVISAKGNEDKSISNNQTKGDAEKINQVSISTSKETSPAIPNKTVQDDLFDFNEDNVDKVTKSSKINILQNVTLSPGRYIHVGTPQRISKTHPDAISTPLTPWRFNEINIRRNPHFLRVKQSALPNINQEMVLDHTVVEKFDGITKTPRHASEVQQPTKTSKQTTLHDFFGNDENKENPQHLSLFDMDQFSPIKKSSPHGLKNVLMPSQVDNVLETSTPHRDQREPSSDDAIESNYFGFESDDESIRESEKEKHAKPFRLSEKNIRQYKRVEKKIAEKVDVPIIANDVNTNESSSDENDLDNEDNDEYTHVGLFEDIEPSGMPMKRYEQKRKWLKYDDDGDECKTKRKRKDVMTKQEEDEAEKWAVAFNSMCKEVDEFPLEIE